MFSFPRHCAVSFHKLLGTVFLNEDGDVVFWAEVEFLQCFPGSFLINTVLPARSSRKGGTPALQKNGPELDFLLMGYICEVLLFFFVKLRNNKRKPCRCQYSDEDGV